MRRTYSGQWRCSSSCSNVFPRLFVTEKAKADSMSGTTPDAGGRIVVVIALADDVRRPIAVKAGSGHRRGEGTGGAGDRLRRGARRRAALPIGIGITMLNLARKAVPCVAG